MIENQASAITPDNTPTIIITPATAGGLTFGVYDATTGAYATQSTYTTLSAPPIAPAVINSGGGNADATINAAATQVTIAAGSVAPYNIVQGKNFSNYNLPTAPLALTLSAGVAVNANGIGNPLDIVCAAIGTQSPKVTLTSVTPATIVGYTYNVGTNVPAVGPTTLATGQFTSIPSINCNPSIVTPIN